MKAKETAGPFDRQFRHANVNNAVTLIHAKLPNEPICDLKEVAANKPLTNRSTCCFSQNEPNWEGLSATLAVIARENQFQPFPTSSNLKKSFCDICSSNFVIFSTSRRSAWPLSFSPKSDWSNRPSSTIVWAGLGQLKMLY
jgi:hypothetical protein